MHFHLAIRHQLVTLLQTLVASSGIGLCMISISVLAGYVYEIFRLGSMQPLGRTEMAPHTAFCFLLVGIVIVANALQHTFRRPTTK